VQNLHILCSFQSAYMSTDINLTAINYWIGDAA
jgi:hypothetical protein